MKKVAFFILALVVASTLLRFAFAINFNPIERLENILAGVFFTPSITTAELQTIYSVAHIAPDKIKVLIVPGHDDAIWGTSYKGTKEADINIDLSKNIFEYFATDPAFEPYLARDIEGYTEELQNYFTTQKDNIIEFRNSHKRTYDTLVTQGLVKQRTTVEHNFAGGDSYIRLYGINKWANENDIDIVLHIHFNDYPGRPHESPGKYSGFAIYTPDDQFSNSSASSALAEHIRNALLPYFPQSNLPQEAEGIIFDQELIAVGSFNTLDPAVLLIEYDYIYEPQISNQTVREFTLAEYALHTYEGTKNFLSNKTEVTVPTNSEILPYTWKNNLKKGSKYSQDMYALQMALLIDGVYPPTGYTKNECPLTSVFGTCTEKSVIEFQKKYNIEPSVGFVGQRTRGILNFLYGE